MFCLFKNLFRRKPVKNAPLLGKDSSQYKVTNAQFVSFLEQSGFRKRQLDRHEKTKRVKKVFGLAFVWTVVLGFAWIVIESAQALELF